MNRLAREASPYLVQHAHNPVDWYPWGEEALARAKREDKPILLSIGYSACHWCHVMEKESFENEATARLMNELFVNIKVDREERPDLDQIYQLVVQLMGRSGGWPLTVFLTPEQKPFYGGTYFPPADRYGMPAFAKILGAVAEAYREKRGDVVAQADELAQAIARVSAVGTETGPLVPDLLRRAGERLASRFDDEHGGFGTRPKFPNTMALDVLLRLGAQRDVEALGRAVLALDSMRAGGIYDQLGGGFHRYSTDEKWLVPHFEKMLYDNALLLRLYVDAWRVTGEERFARTAREIVSYVKREMTSPDGGFYATQDADSEGEEGTYYLWHRHSLANGLLPAEADIACSVFGIAPSGLAHLENGSVLSMVRDPEDVLAELRREPATAGVWNGVDVNDVFASAKKKMLALREERPKPFRDEKILTCWNGLMIRSLADAGAALGDAEMVAMAERALAFVVRTLVKGDEVLRLVKDGVTRGPGFLDDYAFLAAAALELYEVTGERAHADLARRVAQGMVARFWDDTDSAFYFAPEDGEKLILRAKDTYDHATPSGASIALEVLSRLGSMGDETYAKLAERGIQRLGAVAVENPSGMAQAVLVADRLVRGSVDMVLVGDRRSPEMQALARAAFGAYVPNRTVAWSDSPSAAPLLTEDKAPRGPAVAYVCRGRTCSPPVTTPDELRALLR